MNNDYVVYCDESCHLQNDNIKIMVLGAIWCPVSKKNEINTRLKEIKCDFKLNSNFEIKWNKVSESKIEFYNRLIDYFFDDDDLHFRVLIVPNKNELDHTGFAQTHDDFYYKMYFDLLKVIFVPNDSYEIYIDIKDTQGQNKVSKLLNYLRNSHYDFNNKIIRKIQQVHSKEVSILQLTDLLIGAVGYLHRELKTSNAKLKLIERMIKRSGYSFKQTTLLKENKTNIFIWKSSKSKEND